MTPGATRNADAAHAVRDHIGTVAHACVEEQYQRDPTLESRYGDAGRSRCRQDAAHHLRHLAEALALGSPELLHEYVNWTRELLAALGIPEQDLRLQLGLLADTMRKELPREFADPGALLLDSAAMRINQAVVVTKSHLEGTDELSGLARDYLAELLAFRHRPANELLIKKVEGGFGIEALYLHVLQPTLREVGRLWHVGRISVANEHYCTASVQMLMSRLYPSIFANPPGERHLIAACVGDELHEIGVRMVADIAALRGWETTYLGANLPLPAILHAVEEQRPNVVAISTTIVAHLPEVERLIAALRGKGETRILVGGHPFHTDPELWKTLGADGSATDAATAVDLAEELSS